MDRASYDKLSAMNADVMEKSKKANPKERDWMRKNLIVDLKGVEVVETKAGKK